MGDFITLDVDSASRLIAALSTLVGFAGAAFWSVTTYILHQLLAEDRPVHGFYMQLRLLFVESSSPLQTVYKIFKIGRAWRSAKGQQRVPHLKLWSLILAAPPVVIFAGFTAAGVFVSKVAGDPYTSNSVLVNPIRCGTYMYENSPEGHRQGEQKILNDTLAGRAYADSCYAERNGNLATQCSLFPVPAIRYQTALVPCPFGVDDSGASLCLGKGATAIQLDTGNIDTNYIFGINAPAENRLELRKTLTCSPINMTDYFGFDNSTGPAQLLEIGPVFNISEYTYRYHLSSKSDGFGFQVFALAARIEVWEPIAPLQVGEGDVAAVVLTSNSIGFQAPVEDIWFAANTPVNLGAGLPVQYNADANMTVMGCVDKLRICNPSSNPSTCTVLSGWLDLFNAYTSIGLNNYQLATAQRLIPRLADCSTFYAINGLGDNALLVRRNVFQNLCTGLPANQWQIEVQGWFETSLAKLQAYVVEYAANPTNLGPHATLFTPDPSGLPTEQAAWWFCNNQRIHNTGGYQSFYFLGIMVVVCLSVFIIALSLSLEHIVAWLRRRRWTDRGHGYDYRGLTWTADHKFQMLRAAYRGSGYGDGWEKLMDDVPVAAPGLLFPGPRRVTVNGTEDYRYATEDEVLSLLANEAAMKETGATSSHEHREVATDEGGTEQHPEAVEQVEETKPPATENVTANDVVATQSTGTDMHRGEVDDRKTAMPQPRPTRTW
jgi:hypothetical protein